MLCWRHSMFTWIKKIKLATLFACIMSYSSLYGAEQLAHYLMSRLGRNLLRMVPNLKHSLRVQHNAMQN